MSTWTHVFFIRALFFPIVLNQHYFSIWKNGLAVRLKSDGTTSKIKQQPKTQILQDVAQRGMMIKNEQNILLPRWSSKLPYIFLSNRKARWQTPKINGWPSRHWLHGCCETTSLEEVIILGIGNESRLKHWLGCADAPAQHSFNASEAVGGLQRNRRVLSTKPLKGRNFKFPHLTFTIKENQCRSSGSACELTFVEQQNPLLFKDAGLHKHRFRKNTKQTLIERWLMPKKIFVNKQ